MQQERHLAVGVIGMGKMGLLHASILNTLPDVRLLAMYDRNSMMVKFAKKAFTKIRVTDDFEEFSESRLDAVYVTTPIPTHFSIVKSIYSVGAVKNIFVEKTLASNYEQSEQLCQEAKTVGGVTMVGYMSRFGPTFKKAKALLQEEAIGELVSFGAYAYASDFVGVEGKLLPAKGGVTRDLGAHVIDLGLWFFGDLEVESSKPRPSAHGSNEGGDCFKVSGPDGLVGDFDISWCKEGYRLPEFGLTIIGSKGVIAVDADVVELEGSNADLLTWHRHDLDDNAPFFLGASEYYREDEHFVGSILEGRIAEPDFGTASEVDFLIDSVGQKIGI